MANPARIYWDACAWIAYISQEKNIPLKNDSSKNRFGACRDILQEAKNGEVEIATSAFTLAEVCKLPNESKSPLDNLPDFFDKSYILIIPVGKEIGLQAQNLQISGLANVKPYDAIHLASAQIANVREFHTFDNQILGLDEKINLSNGNPMKICEPGMGEPFGDFFGTQQND